MQKSSANYDIEISEQDSINFLTTWLAGLDDEIRDWIIAYQEWSETNKKKLPTDTFLDRNREVKFDFLKNWTGTPPRVLDVGSGSFSWIGTKAPAGEIALEACDALADVYKSLSDKFNLPTYVPIDYCTVEGLVEKYGQETFDYVIMNNALDHSFDAVLGVKNLLGILKVGGTLYLGHFINEASGGNFNGIHQWDLDIRDGDAVVARDHHVFSITKYAASFCDEETVFEKGERWIGNDQYIPADRVVTMITKKASSPPISSKSMQVYNRMFNNVMLYQNSKVYRSIGNGSEQLRKLHDRQIEAPPVVVAAEPAPAPVQVTGLTHFKQRVKRKIKRIVLGP